MLPNSNTDAFITHSRRHAWRLQQPRKRTSPTSLPKRQGPIWASVTVLQDHATSPSVQCKNCDKKFCGGATRIREHITGGGAIEATHARVYVHEALHLQGKLQAAGYKQAIEKWDSDSDSDASDDEDLKV